jgi:hypothetical protein
MSDGVQPRVLVRGVRAQQTTGRVQLWSLRDGWAVFPDWDATDRRWIGIGLTGAGLLFVVAPILLKFVGAVGTGLGLVGVVMLVASWIGHNHARRRALQEKRRLRSDALQRAGLDSLQWAASTAGRAARSVAEFNVWLSAAGLDTPVVSAATVVDANVRRTRFRAVAQITLDNGASLTYRVRGRQAPEKLVALIARPLGDKCTITR